MGMGRSWAALGAPSAGTGLSFHPSPNHPTVLGAAKQDPGSKFLIKKALKTFPFLWSQLMFYRSCKCLISKGVFDFFSPGRFF